MGHAYQAVGIWAVLVVLVSHLVKHTPAQRDSDEQQVFTFQDTDLYGLQQLYEEWNKSTPEPEKNLAGWREIPNLLESGVSDPIPCPCYVESWQGVLCLRQLVPTPRGFYFQEHNVSVVGLTLTGASLEGTLPPAIGNLSSLVSLVITGNKRLTGLLPRELRLLAYNLNVLDLRDNAFRGSIPRALSTLHQLQELDLSKNRFGGSLKVEFRKMQWLRTLNLSRNLLGGRIIQDYFHDLNQLITLDLSSNNFAGPLFNLTKSPSLNSLNLSDNRFSGEVKPSEILNFTNSFNLKVLDLSNNSLTGLLPDFGAWTDLRILDLSYNQFQAAPFPAWTKSLKRDLQILRLQGNNLIDQFPNQFFQDFKYLRMLSLDNNQINETFDIQDIVGLSMLQSISLTNNNITNVVYNGSTFKAIEKFGINLQGNPVCDHILPQEYLKYCVCEQKCIDPEIPSSSEKSIALLASSVAAAVLTIFILFISLVAWKTKTEKHKLQLQVQQYFDEKDIKPTIFTFNQLRNATEDFSERNRIGDGSFGIVYKGSLQGSNEEIAVKQLFTKNQHSFTEFLNEVVVVTAIKHRNLVNLKGCCVCEDQRLLVYEYLDNNDLARHLFADQRGKNRLLDWQTRFSICLGVARGLHYLHTSAQPRIIHRDIKASNVLLDKDFLPKIADFGLALFFPDEQSRIITSEIAGTRGYWAPEYATLGQLSEKADTYSYGVLLLELVSGRRNLDHSLPEQKHYLCQWARELYIQANVIELFDPSLALSRDEEVRVRRIINIALLCIQVEPERRPTMAAVVATLEGSLNLEPEGMRQVSQEIEEAQLSREAISVDTFDENMGSSTDSLRARSPILLHFGKYYGLNFSTSYKFR